MLEGQIENLQARPMPIYVAWLHMGCANLPQMAAGRTIGRRVGLCNMRWECISDGPDERGDVIWPIAAVQRKRLHSQG